jgi:hypothetical protein
MTFTVMLLSLLYRLAHAMNSSKFCMRPTVSLLLSKSNIKFLLASLKTLLLFRIRRRFHSPDKIEAVKATEGAIGNAGGDPSDPVY